MMQINKINIRKFENSSSVKKFKQNNQFSSDFADLMTEESEDAKAPTKSTATNLNRNLELLFSEDYDQAEQKEFKKNAEQILAQLNQLKLALLNNALSYQSLKDLKTKILAFRSKNFQGPQIISLTNAILLRAEVELVKYEQK